MDESEFQVKIWARLVIGQWDIKIKIKSMDQMHSNQIPDDEIIVQSNHIIVPSNHRQIKSWFDKSNQTIYLIKGQGGSDLIYRKLKRDGANIANIRVYQRVLNEPPPDLSNEVSFGEKIDLVVCTSIDGLRAFYSQTKDYQNYFTPDTSITCLSPKMHRFCQDKNLATLSIDSASNNSLVRAIGHFFKF